MSTRSMILTGLFAALLAVSSQVSIAFGPVPHTLQVFFVLLAGIVLGSRLGLLSVTVWIMLGVFGLPVFSQGKAGAAVLIGPTGGFLIGYMVCAYLVGRLIEHNQLSYSRTTAVMLTGVAIIYILGLAGFMASFTYFLHKPMTWETAFTMAIAPFLPFDLIKTLMAAYAGVKVRRALIRAGLVHVSAENRCQ